LILALRKKTSSGLKRCFDHEKGNDNMKGYAGDIIFIIVAVFIFLVSAIVISKVVGEFQSTPLTGSTQSQEMLTQGTQTIYGLDNLIALFLVLMLIISIISAYLVQSHPILFWIMVFFQLFSILIGAVISNLAFSFASSPEIVAVANNFSLSLSLVQLFPYIALVMMGIMAVIMHGRPNTNQAFPY